MKYDIKMSSKFKKDLRAAKKSGHDLNELDKIVKMLAEGKKLPPKNRDHDLHGKFEGARECHIEPDWLLIYQYNNNELILYLISTGSHSNLLRL